MKSFNTLLLGSSLLLLSPQLLAGDVLQESDVQQLLAQADAAIDQQDVTALGRLMADSLQIRMTLHAGGGEQRTRMGKQEYLSSLRQSWAAVSGYSYHRVDTSIDISGGVGTVQSTLTERMTMQGMPMQANTSETTRIEMIDGQPQVTSIDADSWLQ